MDSSAGNTKPVVPETLAQPQGEPSSPVANGAQAKLARLKAVMPAAETAAPKTQTVGLLGKLKDILGGASERLKFKEETSEKLDQKNFFEKIFGKESKIALFLTAFTRKLGFGKDEKISFEKFEQESGSEDIEQFIVAHRSLGYGRVKENSKEAIEKAIAGGEKEIEIDLRKGTDGKIYLAHDSISKEKSPEKKYTTLESALELVAQSENQDISLFLDIKEPGIVTQIDEIISTIDAKYSSNPSYQPLSRRHFIMGYDPEIIKEAKEHNSTRPVIFNYIPTARLQNEEQIFSKLTKGALEKLCGRIDGWAGTHLLDDLKRTKVFYNDHELKEDGDETPTENVLHISSELPNINVGNPPQNILDVVEYVSIPAVLATKELVQKLHARGVKVAVFGAEGHEIQRALAVLKVDLVISDKPDVIEGSKKS